MVLAYCISTVPDVDRRVSAAEPLQPAISALSVHNLVWHIVPPSPHGGRYGCFESHLQVLGMALQAGGGLPVCVFEDDLRCATGFSPAILRCVMQWAADRAVAGIWDKIQFGWSPDVQRPQSLAAAFVAAPVHCHLWTCTGAVVVAHAYVVNPNRLSTIITAGRRLLAAAFHGAPVPHYDMFLSTYRWYAVTPLQFDQQLGRFGSRNHPTSAGERVMRTYVPPDRVRWMDVYGYAIHYRIQCMAVIAASLFAIGVLWVMAPEGCGPAPSSRGGGRSKAHVQTVVTNTTTSPH